MEIDVHQLLKDDFMLLMFTVVGLGYLIGNLKIAGIQVGATTGVLLAGLLLGHLGMPSIEEAGTFGFTLFIFSVGLQAGPSFFSAFMEDGRKYILLSAVVAITGVSLAYIFGHLLDLETGLTAGLMAGALTSTPTLAGAQDTITSGLAVLPEGITAARATSNVSIGYAITYIFGTVGLIIFFRYLPIVLRIDLPAEARKLAQERGLVKQHRPGATSGAELPRQCALDLCRVRVDDVGLMMVAVDVCRIRNRQGSSSGFAPCVGCFRDRLIHFLDTDVLVRLEHPKGRSDIDLLLAINTL